jgi:glycosyltransferase involved in cell wall biosynthesis
MIRSFSVIVPVLNLEKLIERTLQSIEDSIAYFQRHYTGPTVTPEVLVVNEGSSDRTLEVVTAFAQDKPHYKIINHYKSLGIGPARNTGAKISQGDILFFCDGDDLFRPEHLYLCFSMLNHAPKASVSSPTLTLAGYPPIALPAQPVGIVRTGVYMQDTLHPHWKGAIENTIALNLCIRRDCHEFVEGFPEAPVYKKVGCEDIGYDFWIYRFFRMAKVNLETVEYIRYPGNNMDRQLKKFQSAPEDYREEMSAETHQMHVLRQKLEQEKLAYLQGKFLSLEPSPEWSAVVNWPQLTQDYFNQQNFEAVIRLCEAGLCQEPHYQATVKNMLAVAYNNVGSALHQQQQLSQALDYFQRSLQLQPDFPPADLAKVHYNIATVLRDQQAFGPAADQLQKALDHDPALPAAIALRPRLADQAEIAQRGYQFTDDRFSAHIPVWQQVLARFANMPGLAILAQSRDEGRSACWLVDHILTHPSAQITCLLPGGSDSSAMDLEPEMAALAATQRAIAERFATNLARTGSATKVTTQFGSAREQWCTLPVDAFDLVYLDDPVATTLLEATLLAWSLLKIGGLIGFNGFGPESHNGQKTAPLTAPQTKGAIDAFLSVYGQHVKILHQGQHLFLEKIAA